MSEQWRSIATYEGLYSVSSEGRVRRETATWRGPAGRIVNQVPAGMGNYLSVRLSHGKVVLNHYVARLVLEAFATSKPSLKHEINHKNGITKDNRIENLEWVTSAENQRHAERMGLKRHSPLARPRLTEEQAVAIRCVVGVSSEPRDEGREGGGVYIVIEGNENSASSKSQSQAGESE